MIFAVVFCLAYPFALLEQTTVPQVLLSVAAAIVLLAPLIGSLYRHTLVLVRLVVTPLLILCLLLGNEQKLPLVVSVLVAPLAMPHAALRESQ